MRELDYEKCSLRIGVAGIFTCVLVFSVCLFSSCCLHCDQLGSLNMIANANGLVVKDFYYDPWGASRSPNNNLTQWVPVQPFLKIPSTITARGFTDHEHIDEVGFVHMNGHIYDPKLASFV